MEFFDSRTKIDVWGTPVSIGFPYGSGSFKVRSLKAKDFWWSNPGSHKAGLFGRNLWAAGSHKYVTITEGELDALSLYQVLRSSPVVSVQSAQSAVADCSADSDWLRSFERVYLAFDNDAAGREAVARVAKLFDYDKVYVVKFDGQRKDANDYLQHGEVTELYNVWHNARRYLPDTIVSSFSDFDKILKAKAGKGVPYPYPTLTDMTYGIRTGESVLITAQEGVGKTELMHDILYQLLQETEANVGAIFLEEPKQRTLQSIASRRLGRPVHLPDTNCSEDEIGGALQQVLQTDERLHLYSHFGSDDIQTLTDTIRFMVVARSCSFILLDHIGMVVSGLTEADERRTLDRLVTNLEMLVKELDFALIMVSHVNDDGLTRGSRYISKIADIRIDIDRDLLATDPVEQRIASLTISKNRFCGRTGQAGRIIFNPTLCKYSEIAANDNQLAEMAA